MTCSLKHSLPSWCLLFSFIPCWGCFSGGKKVKMRLNSSDEVPLFHAELLSRSKNRPDFRNEKLKTFITSFILPAPYEEVFDLLNSKSRFQEVLQQGPWEGSMLRKCNFRRQNVGSAATWREGRELGKAIGK